MDKGRGAFAPRGPTAAETPRVPGYAENFARVEAVRGREVRLQFDLSARRWPWLMLPPQHPVLLEKYQYFSAVTAVLATGAMSPTTRSALTRLQWHCHETFDDRDGPAASGRCELLGADDENGFRLELRSAAGAPVAQICGEGVIFHDRDFMQWRAERRDAAARMPSNVVPASVKQVGLADDGVAFVAARDRHSVAGCVSAERAFYPRHPYHTGTGDHVNAGHLLDCALQAVHLLVPVEAGAAVWRCVAGDVRFQRFVELDGDFVMRLDAPLRAGASEQEASLTLQQGDVDKVRFRLRLRHDGGER